MHLEHYEMHLEQVTLHMPDSLFQSLMLVLLIITSFQTVWLSPANLLIGVLLVFTAPQLKTCTD